MSDPRRQRPARDEVFRLIGYGRGKAEARADEARHLAALLRGGGKILGAEVEVRFIAGPPMGLSNEQIADLIDPDRRRSLSGCSGEQEETQ